MTGTIRSGKSILHPNLETRRDTHVDERISAWISSDFKDLSATESKSQLRDNIIRVSRANSYAFNEISMLNYLYEKSATSLSVGYLMVLMFLRIYFHHSSPPPPPPLYRGVLYDRHCSAYNFPLHNQCHSQSTMRRMRMYECAWSRRCRGAKNRYVKMNDESASAGKC